MTPETRAGRLLFGKNSNRDAAEVEWLLNDILAIEREAKEIGAVGAKLLSEHEPDELHRYGPPICEGCGQHGQVVVSIEPQRASPSVGSEQ